MDKYIIFVDVDGTLVKPRTNDMPRVVADEFERIKKMGILLSLSLGVLLLTSMQLMEQRVRPLLLHLWVVL